MKNFLVIGRKKVFYRKNIKDRYQLMEKINPITIVILILLTSINITIGGKEQYLISLSFTLILLFSISFDESIYTMLTLFILWTLMYFLKKHLGNIFIGSIYTMILIVIKFSPIFILGKILSLYSSSYLISSFRKLKINQTISIGITIFFRFIPEIYLKLKEINMGMKIRGFKLNIFKPIKSFELYFIPLIYKCIDISDTLTCSIISKGIEYDCKKTNFHDVRFTYIDIIILTIEIVLIGVSLWRI